MPRNFADRIAAAEAALNAHLDAREQHVIRHQNWRRRLAEAQEYAGDPEEARTQQALVSLMDERIRGLQRDAQAAARDLTRLQADRAEAIRDPGGHSSLLRIIGKWENVAPAQKDTSANRLAESKTRLGLVNIEHQRTGPSRGFFIRWGLKGGALACIMGIFLVFSGGGEGADGTGGGGMFGAISGEGAVATLETLITKTTGLPPITQMVPEALAALKLN